MIVIPGLGVGYAYQITASGAANCLQPFHGSQSTLSQDLSLLTRYPQPVPGQSSWVVVALRKGKLP